MSYNVTVNAIKDAAAAINPAGHFIHGRIVQASLKTITTAWPLIILYPWDAAIPDPPQFIESSNALIGCFMQATPADNPDEEQAKVSQMELLARALVTQLRLDKKTAVTGLTIEAAYQWYAGTATGVLAKFTYQNFDDCVV